MPLHLFILIIDCKNNMTSLIDSILSCNWNNYWKPWVKHLIAMILIIGIIWNNKWARSMSGTIVVYTLLEYGSILFKPRTIFNYLWIILICHYNITNEYICVYLGSILEIFAFLFGKSRFAIEITIVNCVLWNIYPDFPLYFKNNFGVLSITFF